MQRSRSASPQLPGQRLRNALRATHGLTKHEGQRQRDASKPVQDIYLLARPLLQQTSTEDIRRRAFHAVAEALHASPDPLRTWSGPEKPLFAAVKANSVDLVELLLTVPVQVHEQDVYGASALHHSARQGSAPICNSLLAGLALVDQVDNQGQTPLFFATDVDVCEVLLAGNANIAAISSTGMSALHLAAMSGEEEVFSWLSARMDKETIDKKDADGHAALDFAIAMGVAQAQRWQDFAPGGSRYDKIAATEDNAVAKVAGKVRNKTRPVRSGSAPARQVSGRGQSTTPRRSIRSSRQSGRTACRKRMPSQLHDLLNTARPLLPESTDKSGQQAAEESIQVLLTGSAKASAAAIKGRPLLHAAAEGGCVELAQLLLNLRADVNELDEGGASALHLAALQGESQTCAALILARADVNLQDASGHAPLFSAEVDEVCRVLAESQADVGAADGTNKSALHIAGHAGRPEVLATLSSRVDTSALELRDVSGGTPWDYLQQSGSFRPASNEHSKDLQEKPKGLYALAQPLVKRSGSLAEQHRALDLIRKLLRCMPSAACSWTGPGTPLRSAISAGRADLAHVLLLAQADPNEHDAAGLSLLHQAVKIKHVAGTFACKELIEAHAKIDASDGNGQTPLFYARTVEMCELLLENGADMNALNHLGQSVLHIAARSGASDLFRFFLARADKHLVDVIDLNGDSAFEYAELSGLGGRDSNLQVIESSSLAEDAPKRGRKLGKRRRSAPSNPGKGDSSGAGLKMLMKSNGKRTPPRRQNSAPQVNSALDNLTMDNLYEVVKPLLNPTSTPEEQVIAFRSAQHLLKKTQVPSTWNGPGTPLSTAVVAGRKKLVRLLLRALANPNEKDAKGAPMLHHAAFAGSSDMCQALLSARAFVDMRDSVGQTPLFFAADCTVCKLLLDYRADCSARDQRGASPLHNVARAGLQDVFKLMYSQSDDITHQITDDAGNTIFDYAASAGILESAIPTCADHQHRKEKDWCPRKSMHYSNAEGLDVSQMMQRSYERQINGASATYDGPHVDENGMLVGNTQQTEVVLGGELRPVLSHSEQLGLGDKIKSKRITSLRCVSAERDQTLQRSKSRERARTTSPRSPSKHRQQQRSRSPDATSLGWSVQFADQFSTAHADQPETTRSDVSASIRPKLKASDSVKADVKKWTNSAIKKVAGLKGLLNKKPEHENYLWELTRPLFNKDSTPELQTSAMMSLTNHLNKHGKPPDTWSGPDTPLHAAVKAQLDEVVSLLLEAKAATNLTDACGRAPLHLASAEGNADICHVLLLARADVNAQDSGGSAPLFCARSLDVCKLLVDSNADVNVVNKYTETASDIAARSGREDIYRWLSAEMNRAPEEPASPNFSADSLANFQYQSEAVSPTGKKRSQKQPPMAHVLETHDQLIRELAARPESPSNKLKGSSMNKSSRSPSNKETPISKVNESPRDKASRNREEQDEESERVTCIQKQRPQAELPKYLRQVQAAHRQGFPVLLTSEVDECFLRHCVKLCAEEEPSDPECVYINLHSHSTIGDLHGHFEINDKEVQFVPGVLTKAVMEGHWLILSGLNHAPAAVLQSIQDMLVQVFDDKNMDRRTLKIHGLISQAEAVLRARPSAGSLSKLAKANSHAAQRKSLKLSMATANKDDEQELPSLSYACHADFRFFGTSLRRDFVLPVSVWSHFVTIDLSAEAHERSQLANDPGMKSKGSTLLMKTNDATDPRQIHLEGYASFNDFCARCCKMNRSGLILGHYGTGKTSAWHCWASTRAEATTEPIVVRLHANTCSADLMGSFVSCAEDQVEHPFRWRDGPVAQAIKEGRAVLLCGLHYPCPSAMHCLTGVLECDPERTVVINGVSVPVHDHFCLFATAKNEQSVHPSWKGYFEKFEFGGYIVSADVKRLGTGILGANFGPEHLVEKLQDSFPGSLWDDPARGSRQGTKKFPIGPIARAMHRARFLCRALAGPSHKADVWQECLKYAKCLSHCEKTGVIDAQGLNTFTQLQKSVLGNGKYDGRDDLGQILTALHAARMPAILEGPPGEGKRTAAHAFAKAVESPLSSDPSDYQPLTITLTRSMAPEEVFGQVHRIPGCQVEYIRGAFEIAITEGRILIVDRIGDGSPAVLAHLAAAVSFPPRVFNPITSEWIDVHPNFWFVGIQSLDQTHERYNLPDALHARALVVPVGEKTVATLRSLLEESSAFTEGLKRDAKAVVLDELMESARKAVENGSRQFDLRSCMKICRRICGTPSADISTARPDLTYSSKDAIPRKTLLSMAQDLENSSKKKSGNALSPLDRAGRNEHKSHIRRLVQLHIHLFFGQMDGVRHKVECEILPGETESSWIFSVEEACESPIHVSVSFPASYDRSVEEELNDMGDAQRALLCQLAFSLRYRESVLLTGPSSFKGHTTSLISRMLKFEHFTEAAPPLNKPMVSRMSEIEDLFGGFEPHTFQTFAKYCRTAVAPLQFKGEASPHKKEYPRQQLEQLKQLVTHLTNSLRKLYLQPGSGTMDGILIAEGHKRMVTRLHEQLRSCQNTDHMFPVCERGIMRTIRFGGICLLSHVEELGGTVLETMAPLLDLDNRYFRHPLIREPNKNDKIPMHPQCYFVCTSSSAETLTVTLTSRFTCLHVPRASPDDLSRVFSRSLHAAAKQKALDSGVYTALLQRLMPVAQRCDSMRKVVWLASMAGVLQVDPTVEVNASLVEFLHNELLARDRATSNVPRVGLLKPQLPTSVNWKELTCCRGRDADLWSTVVEAPRSRMMAWHLIAAAECQKHGLPHPTTIFVSSPGTGKTFICREVARFLDKEFVSIPCSVNTSVEELFGTFAAVPHASGKLVFQFKEGALIQAVQRHAVVLFDGLNMLQPYVLSAVLAFLRSDPDEGLCMMRDFVCDQRECLFCGTMIPEDLGEGRLTLPPMATNLLKLVYVENSEEDVRRVMQALWDKNMNLDIALQCGKVLNLNLRGMLRFMQMLPDKGWQLGDRSEVEATALALRLNFPITRSRRAAAHSDLELLLLAGEWTTQVFEAFSRHLPLAVTPSDVLHAVWPDWTGLSMPSPGTTFKYPGFVLISGPPGVGKRTIVRNAAALVPDMKLIEICVTHETCVADLLGGVVPIFHKGVKSAEVNSKCTNFKFVQGPVLWAAKRGYWCLITNVDQARPEVIERLNSLGDSPPSLNLLEQLTTGITISDIQVKMHPNFRLIFTVSASGSAPCDTLSRPFLDRCVIVSCGDGVKEWHNAADKICDRSESKAELVQRVATIHRSLMQKNGAEMSTTWTPDAEDMLPTLRGLSRALQCCCKQTDLSLPSWVMKAAYGTVVPREFNRGLLLASRTGETIDDDEEENVEQKPKGLFGKCIATRQNEEQPKTRAQQLWAKLRAEAVPKAEVAGTWSRFTLGNSSGGKKDAGSAIKSLVKHAREWKAKVDDFDKTPWRAGITVGQLRKFSLNQCGKRASKLQSSCDEYNRTNAAAISRGSKEELAPNMYGVTELCIRPLTQDKECSYAQFVNNDGLDVDFFVSHAWSQNFQELVSDIKEFMTGYCKSMNSARRLHKNPNDYSLWICAMSLNLHGMGMQRSLPKEDDPIETATFAKVLDKRLQGMLFLMDKNCDALKRSWCLFELYFAYKNGLPADMRISSSVSTMSEAIDGLSIASAETSSEADKKLFDDELHSFLHGEFRRGHDGFNDWAKQMMWDMALRFYDTTGRAEGREEAERHGADTQKAGITGKSILEPCEVKEMESRLRLCRPFIERLARVLLKRHQHTLPLKVVIDNAFLGVGLHPNGARCVGDLILVVLCTLASIRVEFEVVSAGDESTPSCLLKSIDDHLPTVWKSLIQGILGRGSSTSRLSPARTEQFNMLAICAEGRGMHLKLDEVGIQLHESGVRRIGGINIYSKPGVPAECSVVDLQRSFKQHKSHIVTGPDALALLLQAVLFKDGGKGSGKGGGKGRQAFSHTYTHIPVFNSDDPFLRDRHEHALSEIESISESLDATSSAETDIRFLAERIDDEFVYHAASSRPKKAHADSNTRATYSRDGKLVLRRGKVETDKDAEQPVQKRAREVTDRLWNHSHKLMNRPGATQPSEALWEQLRHAFEPYVQHSARALLRLSAADNRFHEAKPSCGTDFSLKKIVKWFLMDGAASDMWEPRRSTEIAGSVVLVIDCSAMQCCDVVKFAAATVLSLEHAGIPVGVLRWDQRGVQLVKPAPARNKQTVLQECSSAWDAASKSCFLRALADCQMPSRTRTSFAQMSDALLAAASLLSEGDYPAPRRVVLLPQAFDPQDHQAILDAWHHCEEFAHATCVAVTLCPAAGPLPRMVSLGSAVSPPAFSHVLGSILSPDTPYTETLQDNLPMPTWAAQSNERITVLSMLNVLKRPTAYTNNLEYRARREDEAKQFHQLLRELSRPFREVGLGSEPATALPSRAPSDAGEAENAGLLTDDDFASEAAFSATSHSSASTFVHQRSLAPNVIGKLKAMEAEEERKAAAHDEEFDFRTDDKQMMTMVLQIQRKLKSAAYDRGGVNWLKIFREYDKDRSGEIDFAEFCAAIRRSAKIAKNVMSDTDLQQIFHFVDVDGSGTVDYETEFVPWMQADLSEKKNDKKPLPSPEVVFAIKNKLTRAAIDKGGLNWEKIFKTFDADNSGTLELGEFKLCIRRGAKISEHMVSDEDLYLLFAYIDDDNSGTVNYEEEFLPFLQPASLSQGNKTGETADEGSSVATPISGQGSIPRGQTGVMPSDKLIKDIKRKLKAAAYSQGGVDWQKLFKQFDKDKSGELDFDEFKPAIRNCCKLSAKVLPDKDIMALFNHIDKDGDRTIEISEFVKWIEGGDAPEVVASGESSTGDVKAGTASTASQPPRAQPSIPTSVQIDQIKRKLKAAAYNQGGVDWNKLFREYDKDKSGWLDIDEFKPAIRKCCKLNAKVFPDKDIQALFNYIDKDGDKTVHVAEFTAWVEDKPATKGPSPFVNLVEEIQNRVLYAAAEDNHNWPALFKQFDHDGHGRIQFADLRALMRRGAKITPAQVNDTDLKILFDSINVADDPRGIFYDTGFIPWLTGQDTGRHAKKQKNRALSAEEQAARQAAQTKELPSDAILNQIQRKLKAAAYTAGGVDWQKLFSEVDRDNSGVIDFHEFHACIRKHAKITKNVLSDKDVRAIFDFIDKDGNGDVDYASEFLPWAQEDSEVQTLTPPIPATPAATPQERAAMRGELADKVEGIKTRLKAAAQDQGGIDWARVFRECGDDSGRADLEAFSAALRNKGKISKQVLTDGDVRKLFDWADIKGEGLVDVSAVIVAGLQPDVERKAAGQQKASMLDSLQQITGSANSNSDRPASKATGQQNASMMESLQRITGTANSNSNIPSTAK